MRDTFFSKAFYSPSLSHIVRNGKLVPTARVVEYVDYCLSRFPYTNRRTLSKMDLNESYKYRVSGHKKFKGIREGVIILCPEDN